MINHNRISKYNWLFNLTCLKIGNLAQVGLNLSLIIIIIESSIMC